MDNNQLMAGEVEPSSAKVGEPVRIGGPTEGSWLGGGFSASAEGTLVHLGQDFREGQLTWYNRDGSEKETVGPRDVYFAPEISPDGSRVVVAQGNIARTNAQDIWTFDLTRDAPVRITNTPVWEGSPNWSPDGRSVVYKRLPGWSIVPAGGGPAREYLPASLLASGPTWALSRDGRHALYVSRGSTVTCQPTDGGPSFAALTAQRSVRDVRLSPNGKWLAYTADDSGVHEVYVVPFTGQAPPADKPVERVQVSTNGGTQVRWRDDGKELYYVSADEEMMAASVETDKPAFIAGAPKRIFRLPPTVYAGSVHQYAVTAKGDRFLVVKRSGFAGKAALRVIVNWPALLRAHDAAGKR